MKKPILAILTLILASVACGQYVTPTPAAILATDTADVIQTPTPRPTRTPTPKVTPESQTAVIVQPFVNVRAEPDGNVVRQLEAGDEVIVVACDDYWCQIKPDGYVFKGCLDLDSSLGCMAK